MELGSGSCADEERMNSELNERPRETDQEVRLRAAYELRRLVAGEAERRYVWGSAEPSQDSFADHGLNQEYEER